MTKKVMFVVGQAEYPMYEIDRQTMDKLVKNELKQTKDRIVGYPFYWCDGDPITVYPLPAPDVKIEVVS